MRKILAIQICVLIVAVLTSCAPSVQDYSDKMHGIWEREKEVYSDGMVERGMLYLNFGEIEKGSETGQVSATYIGRMDGSSNKSFSVDFYIEVGGLYTINPEQEEYPLRMDWDVNSLIVNVDNFKYEDVFTDIKASINQLGAMYAGALFGIDVTDNPEVAKIKEALTFHCRNELRDRNEDPGCYGVIFTDGPSSTLTISAANANLRFVKSNEAKSETEVEVPEADQTDY